MLRPNPPNKREAAGTGVLSRSHSLVPPLRNRFPPDGGLVHLCEILRSLADSLGLNDFFPWGSVEEILDAILDHPTTGHATVASLRAAGGFLPLKVPHVAYADRKFEPQRHPSMPLVQNGPHP